jgi:hypothetical protein
MTFHDYRHGMVVMDGRRCVAVAREIGPNGWMLRMHGGCWVDPRARTQGLFPGNHPELMNVSTRREARLILKGITQ